MNIPVIRQSLLEDAHCLFRFSELHLNGKKEPRSPYAARGTDFHQLHHRYVEWLRQSEQPYDFDFAERLVTPAISREAAQLWRSYVPRAIFEPEAIFGSEVKLCLDADYHPCPEGDHAFSGEFDRLELHGNHAKIIDLKTNWGVFEADTIQSFFYPWLLRRTMPTIETITFELQFVRWGDLAKSKEFTTGEIDRIEREAIMPLVQRLLDAMESGSFPATPNKACAYCSLDCPLLAEVTEEQLGRIHPFKDAARLYVLEQRGERLKEQLRAYCIEHGPIQIENGIQLDFIKRTTQEYSVKEARALNEEFGFDANRCLKVENAEVKKTAKKYPEYVNRLEKTKTDKSTALFGFRRETL